MTTTDEQYTPSELSVKIADEWLDSHRKSDTWRIVDMLRDEVVRLASHDTRVRRDAWDEGFAYSASGNTIPANPYEETR